VAAADSPGTGRPSVTPAATSRTHTVKARETLAAIARKYGVKVDALMTANPKLDPKHLQVGKTLIIPPP
jgi:LysM repeat protein